MQIVYAKQPFPESWSSAIFLAGPTPRDKATPSWRPEALRLLEASGYDGVVMVPEVEDGEWKSGADAYTNQVEWERKGLDMCDVILFWIPREMQGTPARVYPGQDVEAVMEALRAKGYSGIPDEYLAGGDDGPGPAWERNTLSDPNQTTFYTPAGWSAGMPGLTTNVEFGLYATSGKVVLGAPDWAKSIKYLAHALFTATGEPDARRTTLETTVQACYTKLNKLLPGIYEGKVGPGFTEQLLSVRDGGERCVPLHIWKLDSFQSWYRSQTMAGNRLDDAKLLWNFTIPKIGFVFSWALHVNIWIASEQRSKVNEYVFSRSDISTVCLWHRPMHEPMSMMESAGYGNSTHAMLDVEVVLIREFRSPARTQDGMVHELPGGSSFKPGKDPLQVASEEVHEETGLILPAHRFRAMGSRQLAATLSAHHSYLFTAELSAAEMSQAKALAASQAVNGVEEDSERTFVEVTTFGALLSGKLVDWSTLGMISQAILGAE